MGRLRFKRRAGQSVVIDGGVRITYTGQNGRAACFTYEAPEGRRILREEIATAEDLEAFGLEPRTDDGSEAG